MLPAPIKIRISSDICSGFQGHPRIAILIGRQHGDSALTNHHDHNTGMDNFVQHGFYLFVITPSTGTVQSQENWGQKL